MGENQTGELIRFPRKPVRLFIRGTSSALIAYIDPWAFKILADTGEPIFNRITCDPSAVGRLSFATLPDGPGFFVISNIEVNVRRQQINADWQVAQLIHFDHFDVPIPACLGVAFQLGYHQGARKHLTEEVSNVTDSSQSLQ